MGTFGTKILRIFALVTNFLFPKKKRNAIL